MLPHSPPFERNKAPILDVLTTLFTDRKNVCEIASGMGHHALLFASEFPHLFWQTTELPEFIDDITQVLAPVAPKNLGLPLPLDVSESIWTPENLAIEFDAMFTANTLHIFSMQEVASFFRGAGRLLMPGGLLAIYGPFKYSGRYTSDSNIEFDNWLRDRDPDSGICDMDEITPMANSAGLTLVKDIVMPANNQILVWQKTD